MDAIIQFLIDWGYWGLFIGSFIAGSVLPFSSEAILAACVGPLGLDPAISIAAATAGNVSGGMTCYWMGHLGNMEWIEKYFHVKKEKIERAERFVHGRGAWMAFFAFIPILGSAISIVLGMMRANIGIVVLAMTVGKILRYVLLVCALLCLTACGTGQQSSGKQTLSVTLEPLRYFAEAVAGDKYDVVSMVPKGSSPETYDPTPQQLVGLDKSTAYLRIGYIGFEQAWMDKLTANSPHLKVFDTSKGIDLIREDGHKHGGHNHEGGIEPHIWNSARNASRIADNIYAALCEIDSANEPYYKNRLDSLKLIIAHTDKEIRRLLQNADSTFLIYHPALSYFARDYGLKQISIEEGGKEPSPAHLKELIETCRRHKARTIFVQQEFDMRNAKLIADELGIAVMPINPLSYDWQKEMIHVAQTLAR